MNEMEEVKGENLNAVLNKKEDKMTYYDNDGIFKYIINEESGVVVCIFTEGWKRVISKLYETLGNMLKKIAFKGLDVSQISSKIMSSQLHWHDHLMKLYESETNAYQKEFCISNAIIQALNKIYTKNTNCIPNLRGIAKCNTEIDTFNVEAGKRIAKFRLLMKYNHLEETAVDEYHHNLTKNLYTKTRSINNAISHARLRDKTEIKEKYGIEITTNTVLIPASYR